MKNAYALLTVSKIEINRKLFSILILKKVSKILRIDRENLPDFFEFIVTENILQKMSISETRLILICDAAMTQVF
jgi:hypothetical protein